MKYKIALPALDTEQKRMRSENYQHSDKLFVCPICKRVWELAKAGINTHHRKDTQLEYYPILPRYGKPKKICPECKPIFIIIK